MEERQVTIEGETMRLERPFFVLATQNPIELEGTYPLPEAQMDRFLLKLSTGYVGNVDQEVEILKRRASWRKDDPTDFVEGVTSTEVFRELQDLVETGVHLESGQGYKGEPLRGGRGQPQRRPKPLQGG
jgi:MoxR-like ATPase